MNLADQPSPDALLRARLDTLAQGDPDVADALRRFGYPRSRKRPPGFATLLQVMVGQQLSTHAAAAIWRRLEERLDGDVSAERLLALDGDALRAVGFSRRKSEHAYAAAQAVVSGALDLEALAMASDEQGVTTISQLKGFGRWSGEIYLLFALDRHDVFPAGDLAIQVGMQRLRALSSRPDEQVMRDLARGWRPLRGSAATLLWHLYGSTTLNAPAGRSPA